MFDPRASFLLNCRTVARQMGEGNEYVANAARVSCNYDGNVKRALVYRDDLVLIVADPGSDALFVEKLENGNPVVSVMSDGTQVRNHGEQVHLHNHVAQLALNSMSR